MSTEHHHSIKSKVFEVSFNLPEDGIEFQKKLSAVIRNELSEVTERCLAEFDSEATRYIHRLELDLKNIDYDRFETLLPRIYEEQLMSALSSKLGVHSGQAAESELAEGEGERSLAMIRYFLIKGYMPWNFGSSGWNTFDELFRHAFSKHQTDMLRELELLLKSEQARLRLVNNLEQGTVTSLVRKVEPAQAELIIQYHKDWMGIQKKRTVFKSSENELAKRFWLFILDYLYDERGSYFNTKAFLLSTLRKVAAHFNVTFEFALELLQESYTQLAEMAVRNTFNSLVGDILKEYNLNDTQAPETWRETQKEVEYIALEDILHYARFGQWRVSPPNDADYERSLSYHMTYDHKGIIRLLRVISDQPLHVYRLIKPITEGGVHRLVSVLQPSEQRTIVAYHTKVVKGQRREPALAGATHEFPRVLWSIILIILADNHGSTFNQKVFIRSLVQRTSQHFNISYKAFITRLKGMIGLLDKTSENHKLFKLIALIYEEDFGEEESNPEKSLTLAEYETSWIASSIADGELHECIAAQGYHHLQDFLKLYSAEQSERFYEIVKAGFSQESFIKEVLKRVDHQVFANLAYVSTDKHGIAWDHTFRVIDGLPALEILSPLSHQEAIREFALRWVLGLISQDKGSLDRSIIKLTIKHGIDFNAFVKSLLWVAKEGQNKELTQALQWVVDSHHIKPGNLHKALAGIQSESDELSTVQVDNLVSIVLSGVHGIFDRKAALQLGFRSVEEVLSYLIKHEKNRLTKALGSLQLENEPFIGLGREVSLSAFYQLIIAMNSSKGEALVRLLKTINKELAGGNQSANRFLAAARTLVLVHLGRRKFQQSRFLEEFVTLVTSTAPAVYMRVIPVFMEAVPSMSLPSSGNVHEAIDQLEGLITQTGDNRSMLNKTELKGMIATEFFADDDKPETSVTPYFQETEAAKLDEVYIENAGLVLINPYVPMLFERCGLVSGGKFKSEEHQQKAVLLLQHVIFDDPRFDEHLLPFNKLLCGLDLSAPVKTSYELADTEKTMIHGMLEAIISHWSAIGSSSVQGFRGSWLWRKGKLEHKDDQWELYVEKQSYDILMDQLPFSVSPIKYSWMNKPLIVNWR